MSTSNDLSNYENNEQILRKSIRKRLAIANETTCYVLYYPGCFNPVHKMHVKVLEVGKETVEQILHGEVICGLMAPSHQEYLTKYKFPNDHQKQAMPISLRCWLIHQSIPDWCFLDTWEASQEKFFDLDIVISHHMQVIDDILEDVAKDQSRDKNELTKKVKFAMIAGADLAVNMGFIKEAIPNGYPEDFTILVYPRDNYILPDPMPRKTLIRMCCSSANNDCEEINRICSTKIRKAWLSKDYDCLHKMLPERVADYLDDFDSKIDEI